MAKKTEVKIPKVAAKAGLRLARRIFETRGNHSEVHLGEEELAVILSAAFQLGGDQSRAVLKTICAELVEFQQVDKDHLSFELVAGLLDDANKAIDAGE